MNDYRLVMGPCAEYDFDLAELVDGTLARDRVAAVQSHVAGCERCRRYVEDLREVDQALAAALPRPALSVAFDERLRERIAALQSPAREMALVDAEHEFAGMLASLRRSFGIDTVLNGLALGSVAGGVAAALMTLTPELVVSLGFVPNHLAPPLLVSLAAAAAAVIAGRRLAPSGGLV